MNLTGFKWVEKYRSYEVDSVAEHDVYNILCSNGEEYYLSEDYIVTRIQKEILKTIDELNYFYVHQDRENLESTISRLLELRRYLE